MNLLKEFGRPCVLMVKVADPSSEGGWGSTWTEGGAFTAYTALDSSMEARRAEREGVTSVYTVLVDKSTPIEFHDYYKDTDTGKIYHVTSAPAEKTTPASASLNLKSFTAEEKGLPS